MAAWLLAGLTIVMGAPLATSGDPLAVSLVAVTFIGIVLISLRAGPFRLVSLSQPVVTNLRTLTPPERESHRAGGEDNPIILTVIRR